MFRRILSKQTIQSSQSLFKTSTRRTYSTATAEGATQQPTRNWKKIALCSAAVLYFTPSLYAYFVLGYDSDKLIAESAEKLRLLQFIHEQRQKDPEHKQSSYDFLKKFYQKEKLAGFDLSTLPTFSARNESLLRKYLDEHTFEELKGVKSAAGFGLDSIIKAGVYAHDSDIGVYVPEAEAYQSFSPLLNKIIKDYQGYDPETSTQAQDFNASHLRGANPDPEGKYIVSTQIRVGRNIEGYPLPIGQSRKDRQDVERKIVGALQSLGGDLAGKYYPLSFLSEEDRQKLNNDHFLFSNTDKQLEVAGAFRDWPEGRGVFHSADKRFLVWVNEEDELRIISTQMGGDVRETFDRLSRAVRTLENRLKFQFDEHLGYINSSPSNLGTGLRATVNMKLPLVSQQPGFKQWCEERGLIVRKADGTHSEGGVFDISNKRTLGVTEVDCVQTMYDGVRDLIAWEEKLEAQQQQ